MEACRFAGCDAYDEDEAAVVPLPLAAITAGAAVVPERDLLELPLPPKLSKEREIDCVVVVDPMALVGETDVGAPTLAGDTEGTSTVGAAMAAVVAAVDANSRISCEPALVVEEVGAGGAGIATGLLPSLLDPAAVVEEAAPAPGAGTAATLPLPSGCWCNRP